MELGFNDTSTLVGYLCHFPEKGRRETEEIAEEIKERDRGERKMNESEEKATDLAFTLSLIALYQCIKFHLIHFYTLRDMLLTSLLLQGNNSINTDDRAMVLPFCTSPRSPLSLYQVLFIYLQYF